MTWLQVVVLAVLQGLSEFLPISSSGHLVLVPAVFGWDDQGMMFDIAVHFGSLVAVCVYFRKDVLHLLQGTLAFLQGDRTSEYARFAVALAIATIPAAIGGLCFVGWIGENLRNPVSVACMLAGFGILMGLADRFGRQDRQIDSLSYRDALLIGFAQSVALMPGTSRSGITITAGMALGLTRQAAARFSFLLSIPVILLATIYSSGEALLNGVSVAWGSFFVGALISAFVAYLSIKFFMSVVNAIGLIPFVLYRLLLAGAILYVFIE